METKSKSVKVVVSLLALAGLLVLCPLAIAGNLEPSTPPAPTMKTLDEVEPRIPIHASDLPLTITEPNSYYLVEDVSFEPNDVHAITIECNDVTIDLMGYTLKGPDSGYTYGVYMMDRRSNVEIRNGTVRDFSYGIAEWTTQSEGHRIINIRAISNYSGVILYGSGHIIKDCTAGENTNYGILVYRGSTVTGNTCYDNGSLGIDAGGGSTVTGNTCYDNTASGIVAFGSTVTGNTCYNNGIHGITVGGASTVTGNTCYGNGDDGIRAGASCVIGNTTMDNTDYGIYALNYCLVDQNTTYNNGTNMYTGTGCQVGLNVAP